MSVESPVPPDDRASTLSGRSNRCMINKIQRRISADDKFFSLEFYPPKTENGRQNLLEKCNHFAEGSPLFCDVTSNVKRTKQRNKLFTLANLTQEVFGLDTMIQVNCSGLTKIIALEVLTKIHSLNLNSILAVKDQSDDKTKTGEFFQTSDFIRFIKSYFGDYFTVCVPGYFNSTLNANPDYSRSLFELKGEVDAGADFIITQIVFEAHKFVQFVTDCKGAGIHVPIIPGIFPIQSYSCMKQLSKMSCVPIPSRIMNVINPIKLNDEAVLKYGVHLTVELCKTLLQSSLVVGLHFFTLNREIATTDILKQVGLWRKDNVTRRALPWQTSQEESRAEESVRPIFWAMRPGSYVHRTSCWDEFPNGRWGNSSHSSFGCFEDYNLFYKKDKNTLRHLRKMWGESLESLQDVYDVFVNFISGTINDDGVKVNTIPWTEDDLAPETTVISSELVDINRNGFLTINSQPHVSCINSTDKMFGWGSPGGFVFQKAYLEFFASKEDAENLLAILEDFPHVNYHIVNHTGSANFTNCDSTSPNVVTWGVFTGKPVLQPTVVDPVAFQFWKDEAFDLWIEEWGQLYETNSISFGILQFVHDNFYLINLVDNDYIKGNCLFDIVSLVMERRTVQDHSN